MTKQLLIAIAAITFSVEASAWEAKDTITGSVIEVVWPLKPADVANNGNHEIQYRFLGEFNIRLGEVTVWLSKCYGKYCPTRQTRTFELNTFSDHGLMYVFPLE